MGENKFILQTTYYNYNYGSVLQCFATQQYFRNLGKECYLVCRKDEGVEKTINGIKRKGQTFLRMIKYPKLVIERNRLQVDSISSRESISIESKKYIDEFKEKNIKTVTGSFKTIKKLAQKSECEICVAGSDQIWNAVRVVIDEVYFLTFAPKNKRVAIAPSFGAVCLPAYNQRIYKQYINNFSKISVREKSGYEIISNLTGRDAKVFLDPVFLLNKEYWDIFSDDGVDTFQYGKYVFAFFLDNPNENAKKHLNLLYKRGYRIITIGYHQPAYTDFPKITVLDGSPVDFVKLIKNAEVICTDSFHVTAISSIMGVNFWVYERNYTGNNQSSRLIDFLAHIELQYRYNYNGLSFPKMTDSEKKLISKIIEQNRIEFDNFISENQKEVFYDSM